MTGMVGIGWMAGAGVGDVKGVTNVSEEAEGVCRSSWVQEAVGLWTHVRLVQIQAGVEAWVSMEVEGIQGQ